MVCKVCGYRGELRCIHQISDREHVQLIEGQRPWDMFVPDVTENGVATTDEETD